MSNQGRGITVTSNSGLPFNPSQVPSHHAPAHVSQLPQFPAPHGPHGSQSQFNNGGHLNVAMMGQVAQPQVCVSQFLQEALSNKNYWVVSNAGLTRSRNI